MDATRSSLLSRVRDLDDKTGWCEFDRLYRPMLTRYAARHGLSTSESEEIAQDCMTAVVGRIKKFKRQRRFRAWLRGMVDHKVSDYLAQRCRQQPLDTKLLGQTPTDGLSSEQVWQEVWNRSHLLECIDSLKTEFAEHTLKAFSMYVLRGEPVRTISRDLGMTPNQIYVAKSRVMTRIRQRFGPTLETLYGPA